MDFNERKVNHDFLMTDDEKIEALPCTGRERRLSHTLDVRFFVT